MTTKTKVAVLFGGNSVEHEVSIISGLQAFHALDREKYEPIPLYLTKDNRFFTGEAMGEIKNYSDLKTCLENGVQVTLMKGENGVEMFRFPQKKFGNNAMGSFEVVLPVVHGTNVEDGTLMGYLELLGVPYASCDVTSSALGMDKGRMKSVLREAGVPVLPAIEVTGQEYAAGADDVMDRVEKELGYPVVVKPVNLGSSVGISKAGDREALERALDLAAQFSARILIEHAVPNLREINCSVLGDMYEAEASVCEEPLNATDILSYQDKYMSGGAKGGSKGGKSGGMSDLKRRCPADIPDEMTRQVQEYAVATFKALGCLGVSRIDFLNDKETGELWVNEINTIPGSLSFYLWEAAGVPFAELLDRMISLAFKRERERQALTFSYETNLLAGAAAGLSTGKK
ncbi:MAG: D-alanine--D-alanine ligase [Clostridia bacterium]|nr:D-alanine--D-alanine ligase [Clostridia bacterium]